MATIADLVAAVDELRATVASEIRSRNRILLVAVVVGVVMLLLVLSLTAYVTVASYVRGTTSIEERNLQTAQDACVDTIHGDAIAAALEEVDLSNRAQVNRLADQLPPAERAQRTLPAQPSFAEFQQASAHVAAAYGRLSNVERICRGDQGPDPTPLTDPIDR